MTNSFSKMVMVYEDTLNKKTVEQLKDDVKAYGKVKGLSKLKKRDVILLLLDYFKRSKCSLIINAFVNKHLQSFFQKRCQILQGDCFKNKKNCINDTDFYTLEPLKNIPQNHFYSFNDEKGFYYGFNIFSFKKLIQTNGTQKKCLNPYTREMIDEYTKNRILQLIRLVELIEPKNESEDDDDNNNENKILTNQPITQNQNNRFFGNVIYPHVSQLNNQQNEILKLMVEKRKKSVDTRIQDLFYEIDLLGNYTQRSWFDELEIRDCMRFFNFLYDFWNRTGHLQNSIKRDICYLTNGDPFYNIVVNLITPQQIKELCLFIMENLTFTGKDIESRKMGVIYILINLSRVSPNVRNSISWLE
jgi:hypothetical protein